jgi:hypothetical protein
MYKLAVNPKSFFLLAKREINTLFIKQCGLQTRRPPILPAFSALLKGTLSIFRCMSFSLLRFPGIGFSVVDIKLI